MVRCAILALVASIACEYAPRGATVHTRDTAATDTTCQVLDPGGTLPRELYETSGLAAGTGGRLWTHNDGRKPQLFALDRSGSITHRVRIDGVRLHDWEDLERAPCETGSCLYLADTGDNNGTRRSIAIHVVPEPAAEQERVRAVRSLHARYPGGAQDAEALFALGDDLYIVTKGRQQTIDLYRYPRAHSGDEPAMLQHVRQLAQRPTDSLDRVTGATATPDGGWVAIRTNRTLLLYPARALISGEAVQPVRVDLTPLRHSQGEAVAFDEMGTVWVTSEDESGRAPKWASMRCAL